MEEEIELTEKYILKLLNVKRSPIPSELHLQKELFMLSNVSPELKNVFYFRKHYKGPFSQIINESLDSPLYFEDCFSRDKHGFILTTKGQHEANKILEEEKKHIFILPILEMLRDLFDKLREEELLFLIYVTYPTYTEKSNVYEKLLNRKEFRNKITNELLKKGVITKERYEELIW